jgi:hypothetical protein
MTETLSGKYKPEQAASFIREQVSYTQGSTKIRDVRLENYPPDSELHKAIANFVTESGDTYVVVPDKKVRDVIAILDTYPLQP